MKGVQNYYAVHLGREPGVYETWKEAELQILGFSGACFKKFDNIEDAVNFFANGPHQKEEKIILLKEVCTTSNDAVFVFTDGSYSSKTKRCGAAVLFDEPFKGLSISKKLPPNSTHQFAELGRP